MADGIVSGVGITIHTNDGRMKEIPLEECMTLYYDAIKRLSRNHRD